MLNGMRGGWKVLNGDANWEEYGAIWCKQNDLDGVWWAVRFENRAEWGDGASGYECSVLRVFLPGVPPSEINAALSSCGWKMCHTERAIICPHSGDVVEKFEGKHFEMVLLDALIGYGTYSPMGSESGECWPLRVRAAGRRLAEELMSDGGACVAALARPVNKLGATAADFGRGDAMAPLRSKADAVLRGEKVELSNTDRIVLQMYNASGGRTLGGVKESGLAAAGATIRKGDQ